MIYVKTVVRFSPSCYRYSYNFFKVYLFLRKRVRKWGRGRERGGRERIPSRLCMVSTEPDAGLDLTN